MKEFARKITTKNKHLLNKNVICNSASKGLIKQEDFFDKGIAIEENTDSYYVIKNGDFVYNPRKSLTAPYGPVNKYDLLEPGIVSPLYLCFSVNGIDSDFLIQRFKSSCWHRFIYLNGDSGARHDRVSIKDDVFLSQPIFLPELDEQKRIAAFLLLLEKRIRVQNKIIGDLLALKNFLINRHFSKPSNRRMDQYIVWESERNRSLAVTDVYSVSNSRGFVLQTEQFEDRAIASGDVSNYKLVRNGFFAFNPARVNVGSIAYYSRKDPGIVSPMYNCFSVNGLEPDYLLAFFQSKQFKRRLQNKLEGSVRSCLTPDGMNHIQFFVAPKKERAILEKALCAFERKISIERTILTALQKQKAYLLANMFI